MSYPLTLTSAAFNASGKFGQSLNGGYGVAPNPLPLSGAFTIEAWAKIATTGVFALCGSGYGAWIGTTSDGKAQAHYGGNSGGAADVAITSTTVINDGNWHHFSFCVDPANTNGGSKLYVDGALVGSSTSASAISTPSQFGVRVFGGNIATIWPGEVDEVAIYSGIKRAGAFTPPTSATSNTDTGLVALWHLDGDGNDSAQATNSPPVENGTISNISGTAGTAITPADVHGYFSDTDALTYSASPAGTAWPSGLTINSATGVISGTVATAGTTAGIKVRATDTASQTADSNAFNVVIAAAGAAPVQVAIGDANVYWSPSNWDTFSGYKSTNNPGAYVKLPFTGTSIAIGIDVSALVSAGQPSNSYPLVRTIIDGLSYVDTQLTSGMTAITRAGLSSGSHTLELHYLGRDIHTGDAWTTPVVNAVRVTGFTIDAGATTSAPTLRSKTMLFFADSIGEGFLSTGNPENGPFSNNAMMAVGPALAQAFDCEYGQICFSGQGYEQGGNGNVPAWPSTYGMYSSGRSRLVSGKFSPQPDYIFVEMGGNGSTTSTDVISMIANLRAAAPSSKIVMLVPSAGWARSQITTGFSAAADTNSLLVDLGTGYQLGIQPGSGGPNLYSVDGVHPNPLCNARRAAAFGEKTQAALDSVAQPTLTARTFSVQLATGVDANGQPIPAANLAGLAIRCYNSDGSLARSSDTGTSDASGNISMIAQSTAQVGASCLMTVRSADHHWSNFVTVS